MLNEHYAACKRNGFTECGSRLGVYDKSDYHVLIAALPCLQGRADESVAALCQCLESQHPPPRPLPFSSQATYLGRAGAVRELGRSRPIVDAHSIPTLA